MSGVSNQQFDHAFDIKNKAGDKVKFVPQQSHEHSVQTPGMSSAKLSQQAKETPQAVRFEWDNPGAEFGAEIIKTVAQE
jgi:plastocyanin